MDNLSMDYHLITHEMSEIDPKSRKFQLIRRYRLQISLHPIITADLCISTCCSALLFQATSVVVKTKRNSEEAMPVYSFWDDNSNHVSSVNDVYPHMQG